MDYNWAREVGLIRRPATFVTSMTDERGDELMYAGVKISEVVESGNGIGGVMALLWFQRQLPDYFCKFMELCLMVTADHGPAVSGAHNTIVAARAGKDLVSSLASGLPSKIFILFFMLNSTLQTLMNLIFPNAVVTSNKMIHIIRNRFQAQFSTPFHM